MPPVTSEPAVTMLSPYSSAELGELPNGVHALQWVAEEPLPDGAGDVEFFVPPYALHGAGLEPLETLPRLRVVQTQTAGVDHIVARVPAGVTLCSARGVHDASTAELAMALILASLRDLPAFVRHQDAGEWQPGWRPALADRTVLILGYGSIGSALEERLAGFEVTVLRVARRVREGVFGVVDLPDLLPRADVVVLLVPLTDETRGLVDASFLARLRDGALLVNVARGPVVDTDALIAELRTGRLSAAADVTDPEPLPPDHPLWSAPGFLLTPHVGGLTSAMRPRMLRLIRAQIRKFSAGEPLANVVPR